MKVTNIQGLPEPFVQACISNHTYTDKRYSVTSLIKGPCEAILQRRHDDEIERDASEMVWLVFGTAVHKILEEAEETTTQIKEGKLTWDVPVDGYSMSGIFDLYDDSTGIITDYKTASVWKPIYGDWDDYRTQLLYYCVLLRENGFNAKGGEVVALLKDHSMTKAQVDPSYPQQPVYRIGWTFSDEEIAAARNEIIEKFVRIAAMEHMPDGELPPCSPKERWEKPPKFAVMKEGRKTAVKLYDSAQEAAEAVDALEQAAEGKKDRFYVQSRPGESRKCKDYCDVTQWCPFYQKEIANE